jgi:hypothetical protein
MNNLQSGTPSSQLAPQAYKNSSQDTNFQDTYSGSDIQQSGSASYSINNLQTSTTLRVVDGGKNSGALGVSTTSFGPQTQSSTSVQKSNSFVPFALTILVVSLVLAVYYYKRYRSLSNLKEE